MDTIVKQACVLSRETCKEETELQKKDFMESIPIYQGACGSTTHLRI
jgi:hypothetical protein